MDVRPILKPLAGESVIAVEPVLAPEPAAGWNRRLHIHGGRTLSDIALTTEQNERAGRLALHGQLISPGVASGLELGLEQVISDDDLFDSYFHIGAGVGIAASGEVVTVSAPLRVNAANIPIFAPVSLIDSGELPPVGSEVVRKLGPSLSLAALQELPLPLAGILVLQPIVAQVVGRVDDIGACEIDPSAHAFDNWQWVDGCRLVFYTWPTDLIELPDPNPALTWRNRIAYTIFERERLAADGFRWPWEEEGVAIGVVGLAQLPLRFQPTFVDRYSVVRNGGKAKQRPALTSGGSPFLWQARIQQFAEQVAESGAINLTPAQLAEQFNYLPPVGLLPKETVTWATNAERFFPGNYRISARPVPLEQLDLVLRESAPLAPLHRGVAAQVEVLVPVPQVWYDPQLLLEEEVSSEFDEAITELRAVRAEWLARRSRVRQIAAAFYLAIKGKPLTFPTPDPEALEKDEAEQTEALEPAEEVEKFVTIDGTIAHAVTLIVKAFEELLNFLKSTPLRVEEVSKLREIGLEDFIDFLDGKVRGANDTVDLSFLRVQTDIYRLRQQVLGASEATRLATSPVLAAIAKGESAYATRKDLETFITNMKVVSQDKLTPPVGDVSPALAAPAAAVVPVDSGANLFVAGAQAKGTSGTAIQAAGQSNLFSDLLTSAVKTTGPSQKTEVKRAAIDINPSALFATATPTSDDISEQIPIVGLGYDFRNTTIVERSPEPPAPQTRLSALATKYTTISAVQGMDINVDQVNVPGFIESMDPEKPIVYGSRKLGELNQEILNEIFNGRHDQVLGEGGDRHESNFFNAGVKALENTVSVLRGVEGTIKAYKMALDRCKTTLNTLKTNAAEVDRRLKGVGDELAEARHDVAVAQILLAEEEKRVETINARRKQVRDQQSPFLVYRRPRVTQTVVQTPARTIDPGFTVPPVTACFDRSVNPPPELQQMVNLLRRTPVRWFVELAPLIDKLDRPQSLLLTMQSAKLAALTQQNTVQSASFAVTSTVASSATSTGVKLVAAIGKVMATQQSVLSTLQLSTAALNLNEFVGATWQNNRDRAVDVVTVGDLIDGTHGHSDVARRAARELDDIAHIATCFYEEMCQVQPILRLGWAELLSQYDAPVSLRNLASLPRWGEIPDVLDRREMQMLVDWLYSRVTPTVSDAVSLISDLVRICILLASHAPVNQIIAGAIHEAVVAKPGGQIKIAVDPTLIRIGMPVFVYKDNQVVAQAVVNDLAGGLAAARVTQTTQATLALDKGVRVQFGTIQALKLG